jgi:hypothetical protein
MLAEPQRVHERHLHVRLLAQSRLQEGDLSFDLCCIKARDFQYPSYTLTSLPFEESAELLNLRNSLSANLVPDDGEATSVSFVRAGTEIRVNGHGLGVSLGRLSGVCRSQHSLEGMSRTGVKPDENRDVCSEDPARTPVARPQWRLPHQ